MILLHVENNSLLPMLFGGSNFLPKKKKKSVSSHSLYPKILVSQEIGTIVGGNLQDLNILKGGQ